ncbi:MAG: Ku protein [Candidatus Omnitrophica bacterium]|nr:Ku protein [Candidatus Omnitrophota bacterium]
MRSIWSGSINFGLVNIPVKLYTAVKDNHLHLNYLRRQDLCPIGYKKVCRQTGEEVPKEDIVRGYQYEKGDYVVLSDNDFASADIEKTYSITVEDFVLEKEIDLKYAEKPYYLEPEKSGMKVYALFRETLIESKMVGIGKFVLKEREHLVMLKSQGSVILLELLRYHDEILDISELHLPEKTKIPKNQIDLALELIEKLSGPFDPNKYSDTYTDKLKQIVNAKKKGKRTAVKGAKVRRTTVVPDIVSRLKESLALSHR